METDQGSCQGMGGPVHVARSSTRQGSARRGTSQGRMEPARVAASIPSSGGECDGEELRTSSKRDPGLQPAPAFPRELALAPLASAFPSVGGSGSEMGGTMQDSAQGPGHGLFELGQVMACQASLVQGQTVSLR